VADVNLYECQARGRKAAALAGACIRHGVSPQQFAAATPELLNFLVTEAGCNPPGEEARAITVGILEVMWPEFEQVRKDQAAFSRGDLGAVRPKLPLGEPAPSVASPTRRRLT
jgi:hypothetical protein